MYKVYFLLIILCYLFPNTQSKSYELPDGSLENWKSVFNDNQELLFAEPASAWWTTLNPLRRLTCPVSVTKTNDAHSGQFAAKLETVGWGDFKIPGLLLAGTFPLPLQPPNYVIEGQPFIEKPTHFKGFFKYIPVNNDSGSIYINLSRYNISKQKKDTIAEATLIIKGNVSQYESFDLKLKYYLNDVIPDTIKIALLSSGISGLSNTSAAQVGSALYVDDLVLDFDSGTELSLLPEINVKVSYSLYDNYLYVLSDLPISGTKFLLYSMNGEQLLSNILQNDRQNNISVDKLTRGGYFYKIMKNGNLLNAGKVLIIR